MDFFVLLVSSVLTGVFLTGVFHFIYGDFKNILISLSLSFVHCLKIGFFHSFPWFSNCLWWEFSAEVSNSAILFKNSCVICKLLFTFYN